MLNKLIAALLVSSSLSAFAEVNFVKNEENYQVTAEQPVILDGITVSSVALMANSSADLKGCERWFRSSCIIHSF